jgi:hypothetical protein
LTMWLPCSGTSGTASTPPKRPSVRTPPSTQYIMNLITTVVVPHTWRKATYGHIVEGQPVRRRLSSVF